MDFRVQVIKDEQLNLVLSKSRDINRRKGNDRVSPGYLLKASG